MPCPFGVLWTLAAQSTMPGPQAWARPGERPRCAHVKPHPNLHNLHRDPPVVHNTCIKIGEAKVKSFAWMVPPKETRRGLCRVQEKLHVAAWYLRMTPKAPNNEIPRQGMDDTMKKRRGGTIFKC